MSYVASGKESEVLVPVPGNREVAEWRRVVDVCWEHGPEEEGLYEPTLVGFWVVGQGLRRASAVLAGR